MKKALATLVSLLFVVSGLALIGPASAAVASCEDPDDLNTFKVRIRAEKLQYRLGEVARLHVKVTRYVADRELGPAEGAQISVGLFSKDIARFGGGVTDEAGKAIVKVRIGRRMPLGPADAHAHATKRITDGPCLRRQEWGALEKKGFLTIIP